MQLSTSPANLAKDEIDPVDEPWFSPRHGSWLLVLTGVVIYLPGLGAPFIFDDFLNLVHNPQISALWPQESSWRESRPAGFYSFALNYAVHGLWPAGFRVVNIAIHIACGCLLFRLIGETIEKVHPDWSSPRRVRLAFLAAAIWLVHPLQTSAVTCIVQRFESQMALCFLLVLLCLLRDERSASGRWWQVAAVLCFWIGLATKEVMAACLPVALLYDRCFLADSWRELLRRRGLCYCGMAAGFVWLGWVVTHAYGSDGNATAGFGLQGVTPWQYLRTQPEVILYYLRLFVWPANLCIDYGWPIENSAFMIYVPGLIVISVLVAGWRGVLTGKTWGFAVTSFFLVLAPTSSIMPIADLAFEHRMYLPTMSLALLLALVIDLCLRARISRPILGFLVLLAIVSLSLRTWVRNGDYRDPAFVWQQAIAMNPQHARSHFLLAEQRVREKDDLAALWGYQEAIRLKPDYIAAYNNYALACERLGRHEDAIALLQQATVKAPHDIRLQINFGKMLARQNQWDEAGELFDSLCQKRPHDRQLAALRDKVAQQLHASAPNP